MSSVETQRIDPDAGRATLDLRRIGAMLYRGGKLIFISVVLCVLAAIGYLLLATPKYTASARILVDPAGIQILANGLALPATRDTSAIEAENQIYVLTSGKVFENVVAREKLENDPLFGRRPRGLLSELLAGIGVIAPVDPQALAMRQLSRSVAVSRSAGSYVLTVHVTTENPATSMHIANAILDVYMQEQMRAQVETAGRAVSALDARLDELKLRVRDAEERYEGYRRNSGIVTANGQPLLEKQASDVSGLISSAESRVTELTSSLDQIRKVRDGNIDALPEAFRGGALEMVRNRYAAAQQQETNLAATLGPRHPERVTAAAQTIEARRLLDQAIRDTIQANTAELERARSVVAGLKTRFESAKTELGGQNDASVKLRELGREVEASRNIYEAFLGRSRELGERQRFDTSNTRILSNATRPLAPSGPPAILILAASILLGLGIGTTLVWLREQWLVQPRQRGAET